MATTFPTSTYPLEDSSNAVDRHGVVYDVMDDGTPHVRELSTSSYREISCKVVPLLIADAETLMAYMRSNRTTEFDLTAGGDTYRGYLWGDPAITYLEGGWARVEFMFYGAPI
jgi:hypothetical protein